MHKLGFIGVGALTSALVDGLLRTGLRSSMIVLSPRSKSASVLLAERYENVKRLNSNASVVEASDVVFLGVRPHQLEAAITGLTFRPDQTVVSLMAGVTLSDLERKVRPAAKVHRLMTTPTVRLGRGPLLTFPAPQPLLGGVLEGLGDLIVPADEASLVAISNASACMSSFLAFEHAIVAWVRSNGIDEHQARFYVASLFDGLAAVALQASRDRTFAAVEDYETKKGLNEYCRTFLAESGWYARLATALDGVAERQSGMREAQAD